MNFFSHHPSVPRMRPLSSKRSSVVSVLDIGSSKVVCMIGRLTPRAETELLPGRTHRIEIIGIGHQKSRGMKAGVIADLDAVEGAVRLAVDAAERMAGLTVESLIVNISAGRLRSDIYSGFVKLGGNEVQPGDLKRALSAVSRDAMPADRIVLHALPTNYTLDGERGIHDPTGMFGDELGVGMHVLSAERAPLRNLELCINRAHLTVEAMVATPYASGLAALVDDEAEMGCAAIDLGGGTTTISLFSEGKLVHVDAIALGGHHITMDLARGLSTGFDHAERLKVVHGSTIAAAADDRDMLSIPPLGEDESDMPMQVPRALAVRIIRARVEETLEMIRDRLQRAGHGSAIGKRIVLTGGASQLTGLGEVARQMLARNVRIGRPMGVAGLPAAAKGPAFSAAVGLMIYPQVADMENHGAGAGVFAGSGSGGRIARVGRWLKESF